MLLNGCMGLPPVVVGLAVYLLLSRSGPLGNFGILFTPWAMIVAQALLITPIVAALTRQLIEDLWIEYRDELWPWLSAPREGSQRCFGTRATRCHHAPGRLRPGRAEVGAVMIVGGNIDGFTRVMTTAIAWKHRRATCRSRSGWA